MTSPLPATTLADWKLASQVGRWTIGFSRVKATRSDARRIQRMVKNAVAMADKPVRAATQLGADLPPATARVLSRGQWIDLNLESMRHLTDPHAARILAKSNTPTAVSQRVVGTQLGLIFGYMATRVLGQYEPFLPRSSNDGRLVLVGPNLLEVERAFEESKTIDADQLVLGIVLHELGHRHQFEGVPWLKDHLQAVVSDYLNRTEIDTIKVRDGLNRLIEKVASGNVDFQNLIEVFLSPEQAKTLHHAQAVMSLLEGHGNVVMDWGAAYLAKDGVDPSAVRRAINSRRNERTGASQIVSKALGMEMKAQQYAVGERWILDVAERHGRDTFHRVWDSPKNLPTAAELEDPDAWADRVTE